MGNQQLSIELKKHAEGHRGVFERINEMLREIYAKCVIRQQTVPEIVRTRLIRQAWT